MSLIVKIENAHADQPALIAGVAEVHFHRPSPQHNYKPCVFLKFSNRPHDEAEGVEFTWEGEVYVMNEAGKTIERRTPPVMTEPRSS